VRVRHKDGSDEIARAETETILETMTDSWVIVGQW
jgi:hypothetical protein